MGSQRMSPRGKTRLTRDPNSGSEIAALVQNLTCASEGDTFGSVRDACLQIVPSIVSISLVLRRASGSVDSLHIFSLTSSGSKHVGTLPLQHTAAGLAIGRRHTITSDDPVVSGRRLDDWQRMYVGCSSALCAPIIMSGEALGALNLVSSHPHAFSGLQQNFTVLAAVIAPHLRLTHSEKARKAAEKLLQDALVLERARYANYHNHQAAASAAAAALASQPAEPSTPAGETTPMLRSVSFASTSSTDLQDSRSVWPGDAAAAALPEAAGAAATAGVPGAEAGLRPPARAGFHFLVAAATVWLCSAVRIRPVAPRAATAAPRSCTGSGGAASGSGKGTSGKGGSKSSSGGQARGPGYAFEDYELSSDDEAAGIPAGLAAGPAAAAPLVAWRGPLEFADLPAEGAYMDWACSTWQASLDITAGSIELGRLMLLAASPKRTCLGYDLFDDGWLLGACRIVLAVLLLGGVYLTMLRRSAYVRHREALVVGARIVCYLMAASAATAAPHTAPQLQRTLASRLQPLAAPTAVVLPFVAQVRFSRHLLLTSLQLAVAAAATAITTGFTWWGAIPMELAQAAASAVMPAAGLYLLESAARQTFVAAHAQLRIS